MFIYTVKASSVKFFAVLLVSVVALTLLIALVPTYQNGNYTAAVTTDFSGIKTNGDRVDFIKQFGYEVMEESYISENVVIPEKFDAAYTKYNDIQRSQGLNLKKYQGKSVERYSYYVTNYTGYEGKVVITLLIYKNNVIGGDVAGMDANGFVHGFSRD